ncbi:WD40 repeat-like protein [Xylona heveae TC161]|uniref:WD40 repeat-like protein n=1 Tax=Xylona heveae (strain CBS 132557 / TC161) TaxID=1328760 RepID=A0A165AET0_XYLHT|nr:WD40 repeat-like protein [Xylona heveae TC161]KZF20358.1 WD40 repeat-like protein [Xylona heveae TC161]
MSFPTRPVTKLVGHNGPIHNVTYSAGLGQYILTGSSDRRIHLYNASSGSLVQKYEAHGYAVLEVAVTEDNARFASVGGDRTVFLWDVATARTLRRFGGNHGHTMRVNACAFGGEGDNVLVTGSVDSTVRIWDMKSQSIKPIQILSEARDSVTSIVVSDYEIITGSVDGRVRVYDLRMGTLNADVIGAPVTSITPTTDGSGLLVSTLDNTMRLMDKGSGNLLQSYTGHINTEFRIRSCLSQIDNAWALSGTEDGWVYAWDVLEGKIVEKIQVQTEGKVKVVGATAWCPSGRRKEWVCGGGDGTATVYGLP